MTHKGETEAIADRKTAKRQTMARILALVIAGVMTLTVILAVVLK